MALSAIDITPGTGAKVLVDDLTTGEAQVVKLGAGVIGSEEIIGSTDLGSTHALHIDPRPVAFFSAIQSAGLTTASTSYSIGDTVGSGWEHTTVNRASGGSVVITGVRITDAADQLSAVTLYVFGESVTFGTDNAGPSISDADARKLEPGGIIPVSLVDLGGVRVGAVNGLQVHVKPATTSLFVYMVTNLATASFFGATSDVEIELSGYQD